MMFIIIAILFLNGLCAISAEQGEVITTNSGNVQGLIQPSSLSGVRVQKFLNIPYAEAPVDDLRFEKPRPRKPWNGTLNSTEEIIACIQPENKRLTLTEDCLILNIWTRYPRRKNASVMIWIHGGAYRHGSAGEYVGSNFVAVGDVILVTINYRLFALGFLTTGDGRIKGNFGLYDQRLAMKWVKDNIGSFGGNPESITIFGESAGSSSVSAHTISRGSWPYFEKAVLQSGNMLMQWTVMTDSEVKAGLEWFLGKVNCNNDENLLECLRNLSVDELKRVSNSKDFWTKMLAPTIDKEFISEHPQKLWKKREVKNQNVILGITRDEMFLYLQEMMKHSRSVDVYLNKFENLLKHQLKNTSKAVYDKARELYQPKCISSYLEALKPAVAFESDRMFICATRYEAQLRCTLLNSTNVYLYQYSYSPLVSYSSFLYPYGTFGFAGHGLDVMPVFGLPINDTYFLVEDQTISMRMILYWTNFAKTGDPNSGTTKLPMVLQNIDSLPTWPRYTSGKEEYLDMQSLSKMVVKTKLREKYCDFMMDPEGYVDREVNTATTRDCLIVQGCLAIAGICIIFISL